MTEPKPSILDIFRDLKESKTPEELAHKKKVDEALEIIRKTFEDKEK